MRLDRLQILGFKSFADQVELEFQPGLTAIVGPNGCGKSNISDAIRWVLGEQNARFLRGKEMGDVIFNGTVSRKSLGMAEISLEMSNLGSLPSEYQQIQITRRLYRSGESEYLLNKKTCRLKDITDLFLEWGMNKRAYTTIEQGNIDFIINAKPQERRILIETAAGILKYKERKKEATHKMELTRGNLERLMDIKKEVENQRKLLQRQARRAKLYRALCQQTEEKETRYISLRSRILMFHLAQTQAAYQTLSDQEQAILARLRNQEAELEKSRLESMRLGSDFDRLQKELWEKESEKRHMEKRSEALIQEKTIREETLVRLNRERDALQVRKSNSQKVSLDLDSHMAQLESELSTREKRLKEIEEKRAGSQKVLDGIMAAIEKKRKALTECNTRISVIQNNLSHLRAKEGGMGRNISEKTDLEREMNREEETISNETASVRQKKGLLTAQIKTAETGCQEVEAERAHLSQKIKELSTTIEKQRDACARLKHRGDHLESLEINMEGFRAAVQYLLKDPSGRKTVAQVLNTEKEYECALEAVLGDELQGILIESKEEALSMIDDLKNSGKGKATFLPLVVNKPQQNGEVGAHMRSHPGFIGRLADLVQFPEAYRNLFERFLGDVLIVEDLKSGLGIEPHLDGMWHIVTLDGDIIRPEGTLKAGGTETRSVGILSRKREIKEIRQSSILEKERLDQFLKDQEGILKNSDELDQKIAEIRAEISKYETRVKDMEREQKYLDAEKEKLEQQKTRVILDKKQSEKDLIKVRESISDEEKRQENLRKDLETLEKEIRGLEAERDISQERQNETHQTFMEEGITLASLKERIQAIGREKRLSEESKSEWERDAARIGEESDEIKERIAVIEKEVDQYQKAIPLGRDQVIKAQEDLERIRGSFNRIKEMCIEHEESLKATRHDLDQIRKEIKSKEIEMTQWRTRLDDLKQDFSFIPQEAASEDEISPFESEVEALKNELERLRDRVQNFGVVNLAAIEEFQGIDERYRFLNQQTSDLQKALASLRSIINEINTTSRELFQSAFSQIRQDFQQIFSRLFDGGQAELHLEEDIDCLDAGVHIVAQPPGKRLQRIDLLSGGEKALTALALILAVYQLKPSPFCILDEVDAPLDETNVDRFLNLVQEMKEKTQFIIITHCKRTMLSVDSIYGITMEMAGISKVVSVKMDQVQGFYKTNIPRNKKYLEAVQ